MVTFSAPTAAAFIALSLLMAGAAAYVLVRKGGGWRVAALFLTFYLIVPGLLAQAGLLTRFEVPPPALVLVAALTVLTVIAAHSYVGARLATALPLAILVGFQAFRIAVELILHRLFQDGVIPEVMTYSGANFDIVTGITAAGLGLLMAFRRVPRAVLLAWNLLGLGLLATIVGIAVLATPVAFGVDFVGPPNLLPGAFPTVWLPTILVQVALFGHLLVFRRLRADGGSPLAQPGGS